MRYMVFDIDGVLADPTHRLHFIQGKEKNWDAFFAAAEDDDIRHVEAGILLALFNDGWDIIFVTGRSDQIREETRGWLGSQFENDPLLMRAEGDHRPDFEVKKELLLGYLQDQGERPDSVAAIFEDRESVVKMWREEGFLVFQNAPGDF